MCIVYVGWKCGKTIDVLYPLNDVKQTSLWCLSLYAFNDWRFAFFFVWNKWSCMFVELIDKVFRIIYFTFTKWNFFFCIDLSSLDIYIYIIFFLCNERVYINNWISLYAKISHSKCNERTAKSASWWLNFFCSSRIDNKILSTPHVYSFLFWYELIWAKRIGKSSESFK